MLLLEIGRLLKSQPGANFALENFTIDSYFQHVSQSVEQEIVVNVASNKRCLYSLNSE